MVDFDEAEIEVPIDPTAMLAHVDIALAAAAPGLVNAPPFADVSPAASLKRETTLGDVPEADSVSARRATVGVGGKRLVRMQFNGVPSVEDKSAQLRAATFPREGAARAQETLGATADAPLTCPGMFPRARPRVEANEPSPVGAPFETIELDDVGATVPADWTCRVSIESLAADQGAPATPNAAPMRRRREKTRKPLRVKVFRTDAELGEEGGQRGKSFKKGRVCPLTGQIPSRVVTGRAPNLSAVWIRLRFIVIAH